MCEITLFEFSPNYVNIPMHGKTLVLGEQSWKRHCSLFLRNLTKMNLVTTKKEHTSALFRRQVHLELLVAYRSIELTQKKKGAVTNK